MYRDPSQALQRQTYNTVTYGLEQVRAVGACEGAWVCVCGTGHSMAQYAHAAASTCCACTQTLAQCPEIIKAATGHLGRSTGLGVLASAGAGWVPLLCAPLALSRPAHALG